MIAFLLAAALSQEAPGYSQGSFNLVLRWGTEAPVVVRYESRARCETAALMVIVQNNVIVGENGKPDVAPDPLVSGTNRPYAFCIPG